MRTLFIVNPAAGHGRGRARWERAAKALPRGGWETRFTERPGHGADLARQGLAEGFAALVAVGGDGTVGEVADGFLSEPAERRGGCALGVWPAGSGCDLARHFGLRGRPGELAALFTWRPRPIDAGVVSFTALDGAAARRFFLNVASFGVAGEVALKARDSGKPFGGTLSYLAASLSALFTTPPREIDLIADGEALPLERRHLVSVANTSTTGGGMRIAPGADAEDGRLDLVLVGDLPRLQLLRRMPALYAGTHLRAPGVAHRLVRRLEARSRERVYLNIDGEAVGVLPATFEALPKAVPFLLPPVS